jgi:hypothetical protein
MHRARQEVGDRLAKFETEILVEQELHVEAVTLGQARIWIISLL